MSHLGCVICSLCGRNNASHLVFCEECGNRLAPRVAPPTPLVEAPPRPGAEVRCGMCGTSNPLGERYCMACGQALPQPQAAPPVPVPQPAVHVPQPVPVAHTPAPLPVAPAPQPVLVAPVQNVQPVPVAAAYPAPAAPPAAGSAPRLQPQPVIDVAPQPEALGARVCGRCQGANQPSSLFCRYCGASLANAGAAAPVAPEAPPAPAPVAPPPAPAAAPAPAPAPAPPPPHAEGPRPGHVFAKTTVDDRPPTVDDRPFELPKPSAELSIEPSRPKEPSTERDSSPRKGTWLNTKPRPSRGQLVVITKDGTPGPSYPIYDQVDIGRSEGDVILGDDRYLSPRHARLVFREDRLYLRDLDSVNGLFLRVSSLRGKKMGDIERAPLPPGSPASAVADVDSNVAMELQDQDLILIGQQVLRFEALKDGEAGLGPASEHGTLLFGTPTAPRYARLSQRTVEGVTRDVYYIRKVETVLGRESGDVVFTDDPFLSRRHAAFLVLPAGDGRSEKAPKSAALRKRAAVHLVDLGSSNGTFLGLRGETEVRTGDLVRMGQQLFRIDIGGGHG